jgi:hypothetical protein
MRQYVDVHLPTRSIDTILFSSRHSNMTFAARQQLLSPIPLVVTRMGQPASQLTTRLGAVLLRRTRGQDRHSDVNVMPTLIYICDAVSA